MLPTSTLLNLSVISDEAASAVSEVILYVQHNQQTRLHELSLLEFWRLIGLRGEPNRRNLIAIMLEMRSVVIASRESAPSAEANYERADGTWPVFLSVAVSHTHVSFEVSSAAFDAVTE